MTERPLQREYRTALSVGLNKAETG